MTIFSGHISGGIGYAEFGGIRSVLRTAARFHRGDARGRCARWAQSV